MPGELERLIQAVLQPRAQINPALPAALVVVFEGFEAIADLGAVMTLHPSGNWDDAKWGECSWI